MTACAQYEVRRQQAVLEGPEATGGHNARPMLHTTLSDATLLPDATSSDQCCTLQRCGSGRQGAAAYALAASTACLSEAASISPSPARHGSLALLQQERCSSRIGEKKQGKKQRVQQAGAACGAGAASTLHLVQTHASTLHLVQTHASTLHLMQTHASTLHLMQTHASSSLLLVQGLQGLLIPRLAGIRTVDEVAGAAAATFGQEVGVEVALHALRQATVQEHS